MKRKEVKMIKEEEEEEEGVYFQLERIKKENNKWMVKEVEK